MDDGWAVKLGLKAGERIADAVLNPSARRWEVCDLPLVIGVGAVLLAAVLETDRPLGVAQAATEVAEECGSKREIVRVGQQAGAAASEVQQACGEVE